MNTELFREKMARGERVVFGSQEHLQMSRFSEKARKITFKINRKYASAQKIRKLFSKLTEQKTDESFRLFPPFYTDCGKNISVGKNIFINSGCCFQDQGGIEIGDGTFIGQQVVITTINHDFTPKKRGDMFPRAVKIGKGVWIGANVTICPGVVIGDNAVIAAGAVVTKNVEADSVVAGVPARKIKNIFKEKDA